MGRIVQKRGVNFKKRLKRLFLKLDVDSKGFSLPLEKTCLSDPRDIGEETYLYFKSIPEPYPLNKLRYVKSKEMLPGIADHLLKWLDLGVLELLDGVSSSNYMSFITCFIPFFVLGCKNIMFPGEKEPRLISDMTANGVNDCCYSLKWNMTVVLDHVKNWNPGTVFISFDLSKAYLQIKIPEPLRRFFGIYLPNFPGSPFKREIFGVMTGMPWGFKPAGFILRHQTDWIIRNLGCKFSWLGHHLWVDDFLFYMNQKYICDVDKVITEFDALVGTASHCRNVKKSIDTPTSVIVHNGIEIDTARGILSLPEVKNTRLLKILEFTSNANDSTLLKVPITEWETYKGVLNYIAYIVPLLKCWLSPWFKFNSERGVRPSCNDLRESAYEMLTFIRENYPERKVYRKMYLGTNGNWSLWDCRYNDVLLDEKTLVITVDSSSVDTGIFIPKQSIHCEVRISVSRTDLGNSCANELHGALYAVCHYGGMGRRVIVYNDNKATVKHINNFQARSRDSNEHVRSFVCWLMRSGSAVVARWVPGVLLHYADDQSRISALQSTEFYISGTQILEDSLFLFDPEKLSNDVWVWEDLVDVFNILCTNYISTFCTDRVFAIKKDGDGRILYSKVIPGSFIKYSLVN